MLETHECTNELSRITRRVDRLEEAVLEEALPPGLKTLLQSVERDLVHLRQYVINFAPQKEAWNNLCFRVATVRDLAVERQEKEKA